MSTCDWMQDNQAKDPKIHGQIRIRIDTDTPYSPKKLDSYSNNDTHLYITIDNREKFCRLLIKNATKMDEGKWTCQAAAGMTHRGFARLADIADFEVTIEDEETPQTLRNVLICVFVLIFVLLIWLALYCFFPNLFRNVKRELPVFVME